MMLNYGHGKYIVVFENQLTSQNSNHWWSRLGGEWDIKWAIYKNIIEHFLIISETDFTFLQLVKCNQVYQADPFNFSH